MKIKTTRKQIANNYDCIAVGYCELQNLLTYESPAFYTAGSYGWNFDAYLIRHNNKIICITTGYRSMINNIDHKSNYGITKKYEELAEYIRFDSSREYEEKAQAMSELLHNYLDEILI